MRTWGAAFGAILVATAGAGVACGSFSASDDGTPQDGEGGTDGPGGADGAIEGSIADDAASGGSRRAYVVGGEIVGTYDGGALFTASVLSATQAADGGLSSWVETAPLFSPTHGNAVVASDTAIVSLGGETQSPFNPTGSATAGTNRAAVTMAGGLDAWQTTKDLVEPLYFHAAVAVNNRAYVLGGRTIGTGPLATVRFASMSAEGALGPWTATENLPEQRSEPGAATNGKYIYVVGGAIDGTNCALNVVYAKVDAATGQVGAWVTTPLVHAGRSPAVAIYDDKLYAMGGYPCFNPGGPITKQVQIADIHADGSLAAFVPGQDLPAPRTGLGAVVLGHHLYAAGGNDGTGSTPLVYVADLDANGGIIDHWTTTSPLPLGRSLFGIVGH